MESKIVRVQSNVEKYDKIIERLNNFGKPVGLDILLENEEAPTKILLKFGICDLLFYLTFIFYTLYLCYGDFYESAYTMTTFGYALDEVMKYWIFIHHKDDLRKIIQDMRKLFHYHAFDHEADKILEKSLNYAAIASLLTFVSLLSAAIALNILNIVESLQTGTKSLVLWLKIPFLDNQTNVGYTINYLYQVLQMVLVVMHSAQGDGFYIVHMILACARLKAIVHQINLLDRYLTSNPDREIMSPRKDAKIIDDHLKGILEQHLIHIQYMKRMERLYSTYSFFLISSCMLVIIINIFVLITTFWLRGLFLSLAVLVKIMVFCIMGTVVDIQNDKVIEKVYSMNWYLMPNMQKKAMIMILSSAQNPIRPTMMKLKPLNLTTFLSCLQSIYSIITMMFTMVQKKA